MTNDTSRCAFPLEPEDPVNRVTAPVLRQNNQNTAAVLELLGELRESIDLIARQIKRQVSDGALSDEEARG